MKKVVFISLFLLASLLNAQTTITKELGEFSELKVYNGIELEIIQSEEQKLVITGEKAEKVKIKQNDSTLKISLRFPETMAEGKVKAKLYIKKAIATIDGNEGAIITGKGFEQPKIEIKAQEGSFINLVVNTKHLKVKTSSGGVIKLSGDTKNQTVDANLGGTYHGYNMMVSNSCIVKAGSGAKVEVQSGETLDAKVSFGGSIFYKGEPEVLKDKKVIGGVIEHRS